VSYNASAVKIYNTASKLVRFEFKIKNIILAPGLRKRDAFYAGSLMGLIGCIWVHLGSPIDEDYTTKQIYGVAILIGTYVHTFVIL
jgi:hypothetical protein